ncbi:MAG: FliI/YscN family ATPase [Calditrichaeota bacterium]|nr:FliI/YscN family ATPase [Calditrichota bacterium]MCB9368824.1 FliI/YscN family ATPase [Calditrichota bacterium]
MNDLIAQARDVLNVATPVRAVGRVNCVRGLVLESKGPRAAVGHLCKIVTEQGDRLAEVVGFDGSTTLLMALEDLAGVCPGDEVVDLGRKQLVPVGKKLLGRVINSLGEPIDGKGDIIADAYRPLNNESPNPLTRPRVKSPLQMGVRAIDGLLTFGEGQRVGIFAGSGVGKSVLLGMMARNTNADVIVTGLVGERGREVRDFIEDALGPEGLARSVVVCETSDRWPLLRIKGALAATAIAEYYRDQGLRVLLMMDSITRVCHAMREVGLSLNEPVATRGYPPSVFAALPKLLERTGNSEKGSITAIYTVLVDGDDMMEPVADTMRSILDGHVALSRKIAAKGHFPAIDVLNSISRVMPQVTSREHMAAVTKIKEWLSAYQEGEDLISIGAYVRGAMPLLDQAIEKLPAIHNYLRQDMNESSSFEESLSGLAELVS